MKKLLSILIFSSLFLAQSSSLFAKCFIFVHGHQDHDMSYSQARDYWINDGWFSDDDMVATVSAGSGNKYVIINWNSLVPYWSAAIQVANKINNVLNGGNDEGGKNCSGQPYRRIVSHSNGGPVMDFILGNSRSSDPYYNFGGANFANINSKVYRHLSVQGAHRGTYGADATCGNASWICSTIAGFIASCDQGTQWLQTADSYQVRTYASSPGTTTYLFGGYEAIFGSSSCLGGEDDGLIAYPSSFACSGSATASYSTSNVCASKQESSGFRDAGQFHENHSDGRNDSDRDTVRSGGSSYRLWSAYSTGTKVRSSDSSAEIINQVWAD